MSLAVEYSVSFPTGRVDSMGKQQARLRGSIGRELYEDHMTELPFSLDLIRFLAEHRTDFLTAVFSFFTFTAEVEGFVLLVSFIYVTYDKQLAFRLSVLTLIMMSVNHVIKSFLMNPRPFITEGSYAEKWAVSPAKAADLATEYSTPSGHAMAGSGFYTYLYAHVRNRKLRIMAIGMILLTGLSRPYLGMHYLEDVLLGWVLGASIALVTIQYAETIGRLWGARSYPQQISLVGVASVAVWLLTRSLSGWSTDAEPTAYVSYMGFLMGLVVAFPLEAKRIDFDPKSGAVWMKALRFIIAIVLIMGTLLILDEISEALATDYSPLGYSLRYIRYALAGVAGILLGPLVFVKLGLAERRLQAGDERETRVM